MTKTFLFRFRNFSHVPYLLVLFIVSSIFFILSQVVLTFNRFYVTVFKARLIQ